MSKVRIPTKKYPLFCERYADTDREDVKALAIEFAKVFGIRWEKIRVRGNNVFFQTDDSDFYGNSTDTTAAPTWIILSWARIYATPDYYESPHVTQVERVGSPIDSQTNAKSEGES